MLAAALASEAVEQMIPGPGGPIHPEVTAGSGSSSSRGSPCACRTRITAKKKSALEPGSVLCTANLSGLLTLTSLLVLCSALEHLDMPAVNMKPCLLDNLHLFKFLCLFCLAPFPNKQIKHQCVRQSDPSSRMCSGNACSVTAHPSTLPVPAVCPPRLAGAGQPLQGSRAAI